jgi:hypothetical protein
MSHRNSKLMRRRKHLEAAEENEEVMLDPVPFLFSHIAQASKHLSLLLNLRIFP